MSQKPCQVRKYFSLAGNTAMLFLRKVQKSRKAFLKRLSKTCKPRKKGTPFSLTLKKRLFQDEENVFLKKFSFYTFLNPRMKKEKKRNAFLSTLPMSMFAVC